MKKNKKKDLHFSTKAIHVGNEPDQGSRSVIPPINLSSTFKIDKINGEINYDYSRADNPNRRNLEKNLASLEGADFGIAFSSGMAAIMSLFQLLNSGDHIIISKNVYGGTYRMSSQVMSRHGIEFDWVDTTSLSKIKSSIKANTKIIFIETPTNPSLEITDINEVSKISKDLNILLCIDNTFMSPYAQRPIDFGADIVMHSTTKSIGGHSDLVGGVLVTNNSSIAERLHFIQKSTGAVPSPFDCWLLMRSIKTLSMRYQKSSDNAIKIAKWLSKSFNFKIIYPGLESHPQFEIAKKQQINPFGDSVFGNMISLDLKKIDLRDEFLKKLSLFTLAESLGGVESLICVPSKMTHVSMPEELKLEMGITPTLVRFSVGIEDSDDLINDLKYSLNF